MFKQELSAAISANIESLAFRLTQASTWVIISFIGGFRGEEMPRIDLNGMFKYFSAGEMDQHPHVIIAMLG